ncbi:MAG: hypothetical protein ABSA47_15810, partial [Verrucomicrobiota bacterium]
TLLLAVTSTWFSFFAMGFLWPSVLLTQGKWQPVAGIFAAMALVLWHGTWKSLQVFPWRQVDRTHPGLAKPASPNSIGQVEIRIELGSATGTSTDVGWPFAQLSPKARFNSISTATSFWVSLLIGWWAYCLMVGSGMESSPVGILGFGIIASMMRVSLYWSGLAPSFSFRSRLFFGPLIVPKFDQVFVAPITAILTAFVGAGVAAASGSCYPAAHAIFVGLILFILLAGGPTMRNWVLTGEHRFRPRITSGSSRQTFRPV